MAVAVRYLLYCFLYYSQAGFSCFETQPTA